MSYEKSLRWNFTFEANAFISFTKLHRKTSIQSIKVMEWSIFAIRNCFTENLIKMKWLNDTEYKILDDQFQISTDQGGYHVDLFSKSTDTLSTCKTNLLWIWTIHIFVIFSLFTNWSIWMYETSTSFIISTNSGFVLPKILQKKI